MTKVLIVYGTRYGATASTSEEIANILQQEGLEVRVVNAKQEKIKDIAEYDVVIVGSGIQMRRWTSEPEEFLKRFQKELAGKKVALFVSCGTGCQALNEGKPDMIARARGEFLEEKAAKYNLQPIALGLFSGIYDYNKVPWWAKRALEGGRPKIEAVYKAIQPGVYDTRDWNVIRIWAKELSQKVHN
ncbi:MAG: flavodoxin domain-containing protein [Nitrososphaeria archaeon]|jgi:menaquinone-dependent protoporphyrinogen oxidase